MKKLCSSLFFTLVLGMLIGGLIWGPALVLGQASQGGSGASNEVYVPGLNVNDAYSLPTSDGSNGQVPQTNGAGVVTWANAGSSTFLALTDTPGSYAAANAIYTTNGTPDGVTETAVILTESTNTFNIAKGTASLDIAAGAALNIDANLQVTAATVIDQNVQTTADVTFNDLTITTPSNIYNLDHDSFSGFVANEHVDHSGVDVTAGNGLTGGGDITATRTLTLGTPGSLTPSTSNGVTATSHTHEITGFVPEDGVYVRTPSSDQSISASTTVTVADSLVRLVGNGGAVTSTATPFLTSPTSDGTCVVLQGTDDTNTVKIQDDSVVTGSELQLKNNQSFTFGKGDTMELCYDSGEDDWYELYRSDN